MLRLMDTVLRALNAQTTPRSRTSKIRPSWFASWTCPAISAGLGLTALVLRVYELASIRACRPGTCGRLYSERLCGSPTFGDQEACAISAQTEVSGLATWRALLFMSLWWPTSILSKIIAAATIATVQLYVPGERVQFVAFGTRKQCVAFVRACLWFALWFPLTSQARLWAGMSAIWNDLQTSPVVWQDEFETVHFYVVRCLLVYVLFTFCSMLASIAGRALSLSFHSEEHFERVHSYIANEKAIETLTQPCHVQETLELELQDGKVLIVPGFDSAHWCALVFVTRVLAESRDLRDPAMRVQISSLAEDVQTKLAGCLARHHIEYARPAIWRASSDTEDDRAHVCSVSLVRDRVARAELLQNIIQCAQVVAEVAPGSSAFQSPSPSPPPLSSSVSLESAPTTEDEDERGEFGSLPRSREPFTSWHDTSNRCRGGDTGPSVRPRCRTVRSALSLIAVRAVRAFQAVMDMNFARLRGGIYDLRAQVQTVRSDDSDRGGGKEGSRVSDTSRGKRACDEDSLGEDIMLDPDVKMHTWKLGYYLFWNLRDPGCTFPGLTKADVTAVAQRFAVPVSRAWLLLDHNNDRRVTMDEVIRSVEQAYNNRSVLSKSLAESQTVVGQVQRVIHAFLLIVLAFVAVAILIPGSVSKVWTSMSAGLLSFSFVFGNSIQEVFENCIFLFFTHPFDLGDKIRWNGDTYFVRGITLNYVNLLQAAGSYVNVSTHVLKEAAITNVTRSQRVWESIRFAADINTTVQQCEIAADKVVEAISSNPRLFGGMYRVWLSDTDSANKIEISAHFDLKTNGMDSSMMGEAMTVMTAAFADGLCTAGVSYTDLALACQKCWSEKRRTNCGDAVAVVSQGEVTSEGTPIS